MFDSDTFEGITAGDPEIAAEMVQLFREDAQELVQGLTQAVENREEDEVRRLAHTLKSSAGSLGAHRSSTLAASIEKDGMEAAVELLQPLAQSVEGAIRAMDSYLSGIGAS